MSDPAAVVHDPERLAAVRGTGLLDTPPEEVFDRLTRLATKVLGVPVSFITVVDETRDFYKSQCGFDEPLASTREITGTTFCHYALPLDRPLIINDTRADPVYRVIPTVQSLGVAAYAGIPMVNSDGHAIGSFCAVDFQPRQWKETDVEVLVELAASAMREIELRTEIAERVRAEEERVHLLERERHARGEAERRAVEEEALRHAAEAVSASFTVEETSRRIAESALTATRADAAFVERIDAARNEVEVIATAGELTPTLGSRGAYPGSYTELVLERMEPELIPEINSADRSLPSYLAEQCGNCSALVVPLLDAGEPIGALILLRRLERWSFREDEIARARTFGDLAALAFRKIHLLEDAERRRSEIEQITESRARLVRGFSHDLKNPLGAADGHAALLEDGILGDLSPRQKDSVTRIRASIRAALHLIDDLLELARAEAGQVEVQNAAIDVREVVQNVAGEYRAQAEAAGLSMEAEWPEEFPIVSSDPSRVRQILGNLISNAVKYNRQDGQVTVRVALRERDGIPEEQWIAVDVADTGPGIPADKQHLLFQEFSRLEPGTKRGVGLGLAISQKLAGALGGQITLQSETGEGSTFTLWLPMLE